MISILAPSRGRPELLARMILSALATATTTAGVEFLIYLDTDEPNRDGYVRIIDQYGISAVFGERIVLSETWNALAKLASGDLLWMMGDDVVFRTLGWDRIVEQAFEDCPDKIMVAHGDDRGPNGKCFATLPIVHRRWYETLGYFTPAGFAGDYADTWIQDIADMIERKRLLPIVVEHMHWTFGKAARDLTYQEKDVRQLKTNFTQMYLDRFGERCEAARKLREAMG